MIVKYQRPIVIQRHHLLTKQAHVNLTQLHTNVIPKQSLIPMGIVSVHPVTNGLTPLKHNANSYLVVALR